ncbi:Uncharacterised protein [Mycobacteroides abscessus subsp. abscessus]|nr:Uncharacterised protein [Mycobacteroides abscessus subsp. abscessus]
MTVGGRAVEVKRRIGLREVHMAAHLDGAVSGIHDLESDDDRTRIELDIVGCEQVFAGNHLAHPIG